MNTTPNTPTSPAPQPVSDLRVMAARIFWFILGPAILILLTLKIVETGSGWATIHDGLFFLVLALMVFGRWYELRSGQGQDASGNPATLEAFRPFLSRMLPMGLALWCVANILGNHVLS